MVHLPDAAFANTVCERHEENLCSTKEKKKKHCILGGNSLHLSPNTVLSCPVLPAVVRSVGFDAAALWTFVNHLPWFQLKAFYVFLSGVALRNSSLWDKK